MDSSISPRRSRSSRARANIALVKPGSYCWLSIPLRLATGSSGSRRGAASCFRMPYGGLPVTAVSWVRDLPLGADGRHSFPPLD